MGTIPKSQECFSIFNRDLLYNKQKLRIKKFFTDGHRFRKRFSADRYNSCSPFGRYNQNTQISNFSHLYRYSIYVMYYIKHNFLLNQGVSMTKMCFLKNWPLSWLPRSFRGVWIESLCKQTYYFWCNYLNIDILQGNICRIFFSSKVNSSFFLLFITLLDKQLPTVLCRYILSFLAFRISTF